MPEPPLTTEEIRLLEAAARTSAPFEEADLCRMADEIERLRAVLREMEANEPRDSRNVRTPLQSHRTNSIGD